MSTSGDDDAWRAIVENYGERPTLPDDPAARPPRDGLDEPVDRDEHGDPDDPDEAIAAALHREERFVPPTPPPLPRPTGARLAAWLGLVGSPLVLLVCVVAGVWLPSWLSLLLVAGFVGGFLYLVRQLPRGPGDPYDDGARV